MRDPQPSVPDMNKVTPRQWREAGAAVQAQWNQGWRALGYLWMVCLTCGYPIQRAGSCPSCRPDSYAPDVQDRPYFGAQYE